MPSRPPESPQEASNPSRGPEGPALGRNALGGLSEPLRGIEVFGLEPVGPRGLLDACTGVGVFEECLGVLQPVGPIIVEDQVI